MKGYTKIELTNVTTGEKKVVEHKNMVTNAMNALTRPFQFLEAPLQTTFFDEKEPYVKTAFGGIFLFESELNEDPDDFLIPDKNKVVGYGCSLANNSINTMMGSYNTTESGEQEDGSYKHVWDFSTDQGNGEISAVALAPKYTGQIGWGTPFELYESSLNIGSVYTGKSYVSTDSGPFYLGIMDGYLYRIPKDYLIYNSSYSDKHISRNGGKVLVERLKVVDETFSMYNKPKQINRVYDAIELQLPSEFVESLSNTATSYYSWAQYDDGYLYIGCGTGNYTSAGKSFKIAKIKIDGSSAETITITNTTDSDMRHGAGGTTGYYGNVSKSSVIVNGKMLVNLGRAVKKYIIDLADTSNIQVVKNYGTDVENSDDMALVGWFGNNVLCRYTSNYYAMCINVSDCTIHRLNATTGCLRGIAASGSAEHRCLIPFIGDKIRSCSKAGDAETYFGFNPFVLTTKNNLETPVSKTPAQTMKITYVLSEAES